MDEKEKDENNLLDSDMAQQPLWAFSKEEALTALHAGENGLTEAEASRRLKIFGENALEDRTRLPKTKILLRQFVSPLIFILIAAAVTTLFLGKVVDTAVIVLALVVNAILGFYQENRAETSLQRLKSYTKERARVIRDGNEYEISAQKIVPGDILHLSYGSRIPADARLLSTQELSVDESILTGESLPVLKDTNSLSEGTAVSERKNMVFGGTLIVEGYATVVVTLTGQFTEIGKIATLVSETKRQKTPLQKAVWRLAWIIAIFVAVIIAGIFALGILRGESFADMLLMGAAIAVGAIPEAFPVALTMILAVGVLEIAKRKGIMRNLAATETLGSTTVIITDKTGTLTEAKMQLVDVITADNIIKGKTRDHKPVELLNDDEKEILKLGALIPDVLIENPQDHYTKWRLVGKALETNIVKSAAHYGIDVAHLSRRKFLHTVLPFNSQNKFSVSLVRSPQIFDYLNVGKENFYAILGAPDILIQKSTLTKKEYISAMETLELLADEGKRILGLAILRKTPRGEKSELLTREDVRGIELVGFLVFYDPIRIEIPEAISKMESYGIRVVMATGDLKGTALSVGKGLGWNVSPGEILTGEELSRLSDEELLHNLSRIKIFARVTPEDKLRIGRLYKKTGEVVGMTGDGVNDAPSLKAVDIGIAVGSGSDVAKDVADLVLLDDNFHTIVAAIEEGRRILGNIRKSFVYLMSTSLDEVILIGASLIVNLPLPLTALQIIWVNFFTESLPTLAFAFDDDLDRGEKVSAEKSVLNSEVKFLTIVIGTLTSVLLFVLYWVLLRLEIDEQVVKTFLFACFASYVLFIAFSLRSLRRSLFSYNIFSNKLLSLSVGFGILLVVATLYVPFLQNIFGTTTLSPVWLLALLGWIVMNIVLVEGAKWFFRNK